MRHALRLLSMLLLLPAWPAAAGDSIVPIDPASGKSLIPAETSILAEDVPGGAPYPSPPPYALLRHREDYRYLSNPENSSDALDRLKYIPLNSHGGYLSLGGEIRERFEYYGNQGLGITGPADNDYLLQRIVLHADLHATDRLRLFAQGVSALQMGGEDGFVSAAQQNPLDLQQGFIDYTLGDTQPKGTYLIPRVGRMMMNFGSGRLVATRGGPNMPYRFDGAQLIASHGGNEKLYAFLTRPVADDKHRLDRTDRSQTFGGVYASMPLDEALSADLYYLYLRDENASYNGGSGAEDRHSIGTRLFGKTHGWDYDVEPVLQFGEVGASNVRAWTVASNLGYTDATYRWKPRYGMKANIASGDTDATDGTIASFNPLFFKANYFSDATLFRPSNIVDLHPSLQVQPREDIALTFGTDSIWRYSTKDNLYTVGGGTLIPANVGSAYVGTTAEAAVQYQFNRHTTMTASYVHLFTGSTAAAANGGDMDFIGSWISYVW